jgi:hypothetical protein
MTYFNPLIAPIVQGPQVQKAAADKERQIARTQALSKNSAVEGDSFEHAVESADGLARVGDDPSKGGQQQQKPKQQSKSTPEDTDGKEPHLDVTG